ncbi:HAD-IA family hydrolase [Neobacillus cucumis]|uniref:HAD-IA family hydrolase n=1 Tax=Neobacillus cucumis TaxID=1740721 RepID=UPI00196432D0|nr:HAD-IA family hydrolase [Neobacillus cucumis]MBM7652569.1 FMN phosphatase YigB (HAD superfamily) [Neobacillus cucumis]
MKKFPFKKALFMSNFTIDLGDPNYRTGAYLKYLEPIANTLSKQNNLDVKFLVATHTLESIKRNSKSTKIGQDNSFIIDYQRDIDVFGFGDNFIRKSYNSSFASEESAYINGYFKSLFKGWEPDLIVCWEFPTTIFRALFPNALVVDLMPGLFMRPPYPRTISFDPVGLYKDSVFKDPYLNEIKATDAELDAYHMIRKQNENFFDETSAKNVVLSKLKEPERFEKFTLVPLQISQYFGFYENCEYNSQFDFLLDVLKNTPEETGVIATQYVSGFVAEKAINDKNIDFLTANFSNFLYSKDFEAVDNISQFIAPWADATCSISSTIGLQAKFFDRKLISPSRSHLSYLADQTDLKQQIYTGKSNNENVMAIMLNRQTFLENRILNDPEYLSAIFTEMAKNRANGATGIELLPSGLIVKTVKENPFYYNSSSSPQAAVRQLSRLGNTGVQLNNSELKTLVDQMKNANVLSFDIFDTLLSRAVFKPEDVFLIMQKELSTSNHNIQLPEHIINAFAQLRPGVERQLRRERDEVIHSHLSEHELTEELTIREVYTLMMERFGGNISEVDKLIEFEQKIEHDVLYARPIGKFLFNEAIRTEKPVIIVSDFIHDEAFVAKALENAGYAGYDKLYVSSTIGSKKHSGDLFKHVAEERNIDVSTILHIGDNKIGDLEMAQESGWGAVRISSAREQALEFLKERKLSPAIIDKSFFLRTSLSLFAERYYELNTFVEKDAVPNTPRTFIKSGEELGFIGLGPLLLSYTEWIIQQAKNRKCNSIIFFARDSYLPFKIAEKILEARGESNLFELNYIATSRRGVMRLNIESPEDFFTVRIDDYARKNPLSLLLADRFGIDLDSISETILSRWGITNPEITVGKVTPAAIYGIVYDYVRENWERVSDQLDEKRNIYREYLIQSGVDLKKNTLAIDFGYKGSTHRMISKLFEGKFYPAFFMSYADDFGHDPITHAEAYYQKNIIPNHKSSIMLSHNLIIETLMNEPTGSLLEVVRSRDNEIRVVKEELGSAEHFAKVNSIHRGVLNFVDTWLQCFRATPGIITLEQNATDYILTNILRKPTQQEAEILKGMVFDNNFAGHNNRYIVTPNSNAKDTESIWKEGHKAFYVANNNAVVKNNTPAAKPAQQVKTPATVEKKNNTSTVKNEKPVGNNKAAAPKANVVKPAEQKKEVNNKNGKAGKSTITLSGPYIYVDGTRYSKNINSLRSLYRDTFIESVATLAKKMPKPEAKEYYANLIKDHSKAYVAAKLLQENGGIMQADMPTGEKFKIYLKWMRKK